ncbi:unnamed protein product [Trichobilharzia regenti]|nr:unnamed protein product [Trichobilharzia regenti]
MVDVKDICPCKQYEEKTSVEDGCDRGAHLNDRPRDIPLGSQTSEYYHIDENLPDRFNNPGNGYLIFNLFR